MCLILRSLVSRLVPLIFFGWNYPFSTLSLHHSTIWVSSLDLVLKWIYNHYIRSFETFSCLKLAYEHMLRSICILQHSPIWSMWFYPCSYICNCLKLPKISQINEYYCGLPNKVIVFGYYSCTHATTWKFGGHKFESPLAFMGGNLDNMKKPTLI